MLAWWGYRGYLNEVWFCGGGELGYYYVEEGGEMRLDFGTRLQSVEAMEYVTFCTRSAINGPARIR